MLITAKYKMANKPAEALIITESVDYDANKQEQITARLEKRDQNRIVEADQKRAEREKRKVVEEKSSFFTKHFQKEYENINNMTECDGIFPDDRPGLVDHFDAITVSLHRLQKFYNDSFMFLNAFECQKYQKQLAALQQTINQRRGVMLPKKKFAFKSKTKNSMTTGTLPRNEPTALEKYESKAAQFKQDCEVNQKNGETIVLSGDDINLKDISLSQLDNCKVYLYGAPGTVHISDVKNCLIVIGPVSGSVFVDRCSKTIVATGCQQLRVHRTENTDFYLHVTSRAIIEDTSAVRFAPYNVVYANRDEHFKISGLDQNKNNWTLVDDFNWLAMETASPNWKLMDETDRKNNWA